MKPVLTKEDLQIGLDFWLWAVENPSEYKDGWPRINELHSYMNSCPFCEEHVDFQTFECVNTCPLVVKHMTCLRVINNPYTIWSNKHNTNEAISSAALIIANVFRDEIEKLKQK